MSEFHFLRFLLSFLDIFCTVVVFCSSRVAYLSVRLSPFFCSYEIRW